MILKRLFVVVVYLLLVSNVVVAGTWQTNQSIGGFSRVHIYTPNTQSEIGDGRALLLVLHGCTQSIDAYLTANLEVAADTYGMVIAVPDAQNKAGFGCWSYWQGAKSRNQGDYSNLISLATALSNDSSYNIDSDQVYISGLSSGAAFANTTACLAPDIFAGMGISAGPSIGTSSSGALGTCEAANVTLRCEQYAGSFDGFFDTQIASLAFGKADTTVDQCYNRQNAEGMAGVYGVAELPGTNVVSESGRTADETVWQDNRVTMLFFDGVDHAWSGGAGANGSFINGNGINYALYLGEYFLQNNLRVSRNESPVVSNVSGQSIVDQISITGDVTDADGFVEQVNVLITDLDGNTFQFSETNIPTNSFAIVSSALPDSLYFIDVTALDDQGATSNTVSLTVRIGPEPPPVAPQITNTQVSVEGQCATVSAEVFDANQDLDTVTVTFSTGTKAAVGNSTFTAQECDLPGGLQTAEIEAVDQSGLSSLESVTFEIDAGQTATLSEHISADRLDFTNYANCYLEYGSSPFKLNEIAINADQCQWQDDDASCIGPIQACTNSGGGGNGSGGNPGGPTNPQCEQFNTSNYFHKLAGRAFSTGSFFAPDYFAQGTNEPLPGSTFGTNNLFSTDGENWQLGQCP